MNIKEAIDYIDSFGEDGPSMYPMASLTANGEQALRAFIEKNASEPERHNMDVWIEDAGTEAMNLLAGYSSSIELPPRMSATHNPVLFYITPEMVEFTI